jgi:hypothetical protein
MPYYSRLAIVLFPEFNAFYRLKRAKVDTDFGLRISPLKGSEGFRRLEWADGTSIDGGWKPSVPHVIPKAPVPRRPVVQRAEGVSHE